MEYEEQSDGFTSKEGTESKGQAVIHFGEGLLYSSGDSEPPPEHCELDHTKGKIALSSNTEVLKKLRSKQTKTEKRSSLTSAARIKVVAECHRSQFSAPAPERSDPFFDNRRSGCGLGRSFQRNIPDGKVVHPPKA